MKKIIILMSVLVCSSSILLAQSHSDHDRNRPPQEVEQAFHNDHPDTKNVNWHHSNHQWHERHIQVGSKVYEDNYYDARGRRIDTHHEIVTQEVPVEVDRHFRDHYHGIHHYRAIRIERPEQPALFQITWTVGGKHRVMYTDEHGAEVTYRDRH